MKCPNCDQLLQITERLNVEIDYCPSCRGVWLDKGELDKIIDYANQPMAQVSKKYKDDDDDDDDVNYSDKSKKTYKNDKDFDNRNYPNKKKNSFLGDLFDFG
jgi:uncharacterized protein